jgi:hypothetical protein
MPANMDVPRRGTGGGARARASDCPRFRHLVGRVWHLGPRPFGELLLDVAADHGALIRRLERYARIDPALVEAADARDWLEPRALVRIIDKTEGAGRPW